MHFSAETVGRSDSIRKSKKAGHYGKGEEKKRGDGGGGLGEVL